MFGFVHTLFGIAHGMATVFKDLSCLIFKRKNYVNMLPRCLIGPLSRCCVRHSRGSPEFARRSKQSVHCEKSFGIATVYPSFENGEVTAIYNVGGGVSAIPRKSASKVCGAFQADFP